MKDFWTWLGNQDDDVLKLLAWAVFLPVFLVWLVFLARSASQGHYLTAVVLLFLPAACLFGLACAGYRAKVKSEGRDNG